MKAQISITGAKRVSAGLKQIGIKFRKGFTPELVKTAYKHAYKNAPHKTGALRRAIQYNIKKNSGFVRVVQPRDKRNRPYHLWQHGIKAPSPTGKNGAGKGYDLRFGKFRPKSGIPWFMEEMYYYMEGKSVNIIENEMRNLFGSFKN